MLFRSDKGWLYISNSASSINKCLATAAGDAPSIATNGRFKKEGLTPQGQVTSASFTDTSDSGSELATALMTLPMPGMFIPPTPEAQQAMEILRRTGYADAPAGAVVGRMGYARAWLDSFAPEDLRFIVQPTLPPETAELSDEQRRFLGKLARGLRSEMQGQAIHELIYELAGEFEGSRPADLFRAIYLSLLGKPRGPRAGSFLAVLGPDFSAQRFKEAAGDRS